MQEGIGRGGYRVLATVFLGLGLLGLASLILAWARDSVPALVLGIALVSVALVVLFVLALRALAGANPGPASAGVPPSSRVLDLDYLEADEGLEADGASPAEPGERIPVPPNRNLVADTKGWPSRKGPTGVTRGEAKKREAGRPVEFAPVPGRVAVPKASLRSPSEPPTVLARETSRNAKAPEGMAKGQCGTCGIILLAPKVRPLKLRCPKCQKVTTLS